MEDGWRELLLASVPLLEPKGPASTCHSDLQWRGLGQHHLPLPDGGQELGKSSELMLGCLLLNYFHMSRQKGCWEDEGQCWAFRLLLLLSFSN